MAAELCFWLSIALLLYTYAGYPLVLCLLTLRYGRTVPKVRAEPTVSLIIPAFNEGKVIAAKIRNSLDLDYPEEKLNILVVSDGSTDDTAHLARIAPNGHRVEVLDFPHRGKTRLLTESLRHTNAEIVVISDATVMLNRTAIRSLVANFSDPGVAAVSGAYQLSAGSNRIERWYWDYESYLKKHESALGSVCYVHGALYSIRKSLYPTLAPHFLNDDNVIPLNLLGAGYRVLYEPEALATDLDNSRSFRQRVRTVSGSLQSCSEIKRLVAPLRAIPLFCFVSRTVLRFCVPLLLIVMGWMNLILASRPLYRSLLVLHVGFYVSALIGTFYNWQSSIAGLPYYFCMRHVPILLAAFHAVFRFRKVRWR